MTAKPSARHVRREDDPQPEAQLTVVRSIGRPTVLHEPWAKITVVMDHRQVAYLDLVGVAIRVRHFTAITRAEIVRALVEFMEKSGIDFSKFSTVEAMVEYLTEYFATLPRRGRFSLLDSNTVELFASEDREGWLRERRRLMS
ncbi:MAG: hypothetical protein ACXW5U_32260 [Thermoanaerobaculia bacterium]